jgi:acyl-CoA thioesterase FadM
MTYRAPALPDQIVRVIARLRDPAVARFVIDYEIRNETGNLLATGLTEQVVVKSDGELLLTMPSGLRAMCTSILAYQEVLDAEPAP